MLTILFLLPFTHSPFTHSDVRFPFCTSFPLHKLCYLLHISQLHILLKPFTHFSPLHKFPQICFLKAIPFYTNETPLNTPILITSLKELCSKNVVTLFLCLDYYTFYYDCQHFFRLFIEVYLHILCYYIVPM